jgi:hypothetical protein
MNESGKSFYFTSKKGHPIFIQRLKYMTVEYAKSFELDQIELFYYILHEKMIKILFASCSKHKNKRIDQIISIFDLEGFALWSFYSKVK